MAPYQRVFLPGPPGQRAKSVQIGVRAEHQSWRRGGPARGVLGEARAHAAFRSAPRSGMGQSLLLKQLHFLPRRQEKGPLPAQFPHLPSGRSCGHPDRPLYRERVLLYCIRKEASRGASVHVAVWTRGQERNPLRAWHSMLPTAGSFLASATSAFQGPLPSA